MGVLKAAYGTVCVIQICSGNALPLASQIICLLKQLVELSRLIHCHELCPNPPGNLRIYFIVYSTLELCFMQSFTALHKVLKKDL